MAAEHRRVAAQTPEHARALAQNLAKQEFAIEAQTGSEWLLRRRRRRGDITVTITIASGGTPRPLPPPPQQRSHAGGGASSWPPPVGPPAS